MEAYERAKQQRPVYENPYEAEQTRLYNQIVNRPGFTYDAASDALYQNYKQSYARQGALAMRDTMGEAASLTGGYSSSYSQSAGQQQYNAYLQKLSEVFPETYAMAYEQYRSQGEHLQNQYNMVENLTRQGYQQYQDKLSEYYNLLSGLQQRADVAYDREQQAEQTAYNRRQDELDRQQQAEQTAYNRQQDELDRQQQAEQTAYNRQQQAEQTAYDRQQDSLKQQKTSYDRLVEMMLTMGYVPDEAELAAAGMSQKAADAYKAYYALSTVGSGQGGGSGSSNSKSYRSALDRARSALKKSGDIEAVNGGIARQVASGELTAEEGRKLITALTKEHFA